MSYAILLPLSAIVGFVIGRERLHDMTWTDAVFREMLDQFGIGCNDAVRIGLPCGRDDEIVLEIVMLGAQGEGIVAGLLVD